MKIKTAKDLMRRYLDEDWSVLPVYKEPLEAINGIYTGDCIDVCRRLMLDGTHVDLVYMDPPYNTGRSFAKGLYSFDDNFGTGLDGMYNYLRYLYPRVLLMHRVLKDTGSIYLHCDWHANSYIRTLILDPVFGENNFINEIIWQKDAGTRGNKYFPRKHDTIFWYSKSNRYLFNYNDIGLRIPYNSTASGMHFKHIDEEGKKYRLYPNGKKFYLDEGKLVDDVWIGISTQSAASPLSKERIGYPTQKPEALLERIIKASSNEGDTVLDPFMGSGTTIAVAKKTNRQFIGCDISSEAVKVSIKRLLV